MGIIISAIAITTNCIKGSLTRKKTNPTEEEGSPHGPLPNSSQLSPSQAADLAVEGPRNKHAATSPPPAPTSPSHPDGTGETVLSERTDIEGLKSTNPNPNPNNQTTQPQPQPQPQQSHSNSLAPNQTINLNTSAMASDEDYTAFLDKANADPNEGVSKTQSSKGKMELKAVDQGVDIPAALKKVTKDAFYISDADEPFEAVGLKYAAKSLPDEASFAKLVGHPSPKDADVSILDIGEWDSQGQYKDVVDATREAAKGGDVRVYRISRDGSRIEYWVVGVTDGKLLGARALAIES